MQLLEQIVRDRRCKNITKLTFKGIKFDKNTIFHTRKISFRVFMRVCVCAVIEMIYMWGVRINLD